MHPEDLQPGTWIVVELVRGEKLADELPHDTFCCPFGEQYVVDRVRSLQVFVGVPLWCTAVQFPFVYATNGNDGQARATRYVLDLRKVVVAALRPDVIAGLGLSATPVIEAAAAIAAPQPLRLPAAESRGDDDANTPALEEGEDEGGDESGAAVPA